MCQFKFTRETLLENNGEEKLGRNNAENSSSLLSLFRQVFKRTTPILWFSLPPLTVYFYFRVVLVSQNVIRFKV